MGSKRALFTEKYFKNLADAIRGLLRTKRKYKVSEMAEAIRSYDNYEYDVEYLLKSINLDKHFGWDFDAAMESGGVVITTDDNKVIYYPCDKALHLMATRKPPEDRDSDWVPIIGCRADVDHCHYPAYFTDTNKRTNGIEKTELAWFDEFTYYGTPEYTQWIYWDASKSFMGLDDATEMQDWTVEFYMMDPDINPRIKDYVIGPDRRVRYGDLFMIPFDYIDVRVYGETIIGTGRDHLYSEVVNDIFLVRYENGSCDVIMKTSAEDAVFDESRDYMNLAYKCFIYDLDLSPSYGLNYEVNPNQYAITDLGFTVTKENLHKLIIRNTVPIYDTSGNIILEANATGEDIIPGYDNPEGYSWSLYGTPLILDEEHSLIRGREHRAPLLFMDAKHSECADIYEVEFNIVPTYCGSTRTWICSYQEGRSGDWSPFTFYIDENLIFYVSIEVDNMVIELGNWSADDVKFSLTRVAGAEFKLNIYRNGIIQNVLVTTNKGTSFQKDIIVHSNDYNDVTLQPGCWNMDGRDCPIGVLNTLNYWARKRGDR